MGRRLCALVVVGAVVLGGCGGSSKNKTAKKVTPVAPAATKVVPQSLRVASSLPAAPSKGRTRARTGTAPVPVEQLSDALTAFRQAAATGSCEKLAPLRHNAERPAGANLGSPPTAQECADFNANTLPYVKDLVPVANETFGTTAAVVDYTQNGKDLTGLWMVEPDGHWRYLVNGQFLAHSVGTRPSPSTLFDEGVNGFISAAQTRDCAGMFRSINPDSPFLPAAGTQDGLCGVVTPLYDRAHNFFHYAAADPTAKPRLLGATRLYGIYDIDFSNNNYWILVGKVTPSNVPDARKAGHLPAGFQQMYAGSYSPS
jgi:hypothetical protein